VSLRTSVQRVPWRTTSLGLRVPRLGAKLKDGQVALLLVLPGAGFMLLYAVYPLGVVVQSAFLRWDSIVGDGHWVGIANFQWVLSDPVFRDSLGRSLYYTVGSTGLQVILSLGIALLLNRSVRGRNIARGAILFPIIVPSVVVALIFGYMFNEVTGVVNYLLTSAKIIHSPLTWLAAPSTALTTVVLVATWKYLPFMVLLLLARLQTVPTAVLEAGLCDGCNSWQLFRYIVLPWIMPALLVAVMLRTIFSFNDYDIPFLLGQGGPADSTLVLPVLIRRLVFDEFDLGRASAATVVMLGLLIMATLVYVSLYRRGEAALE
jgi:multiple sugar transport system permease protein